MALRLRSGCTLNLVGGGSVALECGGVLMTLETTEIGQRSTRCIACGSRWLTESASTCVEGGQGARARRGKLLAHRPSFEHAEGATDSPDFE